MNGRTPENTPGAGQIGQEAAPGIAGTQAPEETADTIREQIRGINKALKLDPKADNTTLLQERARLLERLQEIEPDVMHIDFSTDVDPRLDPNSPQFDLDLYRESLAAVDWEGIRARLDAAELKISKSVASFLESADYERLRTTIATSERTIQAAIETFAKFAGQRDFIGDVLQRIKSALEEMTPEEWEALQAEIDAEDKAAQNENQIALPEFEARSGTERKDPLQKIVDKATEETIQGYILQGKATNALTKAKPNKRNTSIDPVTGDATIKSGDITLKIKHYSDISDPRTSTYQLLDLITETLTRTGAKDHIVELSLSEYMERRGLKDRKEARKQVVEDLETLYNASISLTESRSGKEQSFLDMRICDAKGIKNGIISFSFGNVFFSLLKGYAIMPYPAPLYKINGKRNPFSYQLGRKIAEHKNMNAGKKNEDIIAVKTLLKVCEGLPSKKEVASTDRHYLSRIIEPFERDLNALETMLTWEYCHRNGTPLTDEELKDFSFETFENALILTHWKDYPDQTKRLEDRQARIDEAKAAQEASQKKKRGRPPKQKK